MRNYIKYLRVIYLATLAMTAQSGHSQSEAELEIVGTPTINGSGCPTGSASMIVTNSTQDGPRDYFQAVYDTFIVERTPQHKIKDKVNKSCKVIFQLQYTKGYSFRLDEIEYDGYAELGRQVKGVIRTSYGFGRNPKNLKRRRGKQVKGKEVLKGPEKNGKDYSFSEEFGFTNGSENTDNDQWNRKNQKMWSPCKKNNNPVYFVLKTDLKIAYQKNDKNGKPIKKKKKLKNTSMLTLDIKSAAFHQKMSITWKKCK